MNNPAFELKVQAYLQRMLELVKTSGTAESSYRIAYWMATWLWKNTSGIYRLADLENAVFQRLQLNNCSNLTQGPPQKKEAHLATTVYPHGGHTSLLRHMIKEAKFEADLILTRQKDLDQIAPFVGAGAVVTMKPRPASNPATDVMELTKILLSYERVILHIHPNDLTSALSIKLLKSLRPSTQVFFTNHADHAFSVAIDTSDNILEISKYGWSLREKRGSLEKSSFIGIPIQRGAPSPRKPLKSDHPHLVTGGAPYKYKPALGMSLPQAISKLLSRNPGYHFTAIGPKNTDLWWWALKIQHPTRVALRGMMPKSAYQELMRECSVYIDSHPLTGGTALPESLMRGCHIAGLRGVSWGYSPADDLMSESIDHFLQHCKNLAESDPVAVNEQEAVRIKCIESHDPASVRRRLDDLIETGKFHQPFASNTPKPSSQKMEDMWRINAVSSVPSRKECPLSRSDRINISRNHAALYGWLHPATLTLIRQAVRG